MTSATRDHEPGPVGVLGYGTMGGGMGASLLAAGIEVIAFDVTAPARARAGEDGATVAASPRDLGSRCDVVLVSLPDPTKVAAAVLDDEDSLLAGMSAGATLIDTTTSSPAMVARVGAACRAKGVAHLDSPVSGRPPTMSMLIGGPVETVERCRPVLEAISSEQFLLGAAGTGTVTKLMNQYVSFASFLLICGAVEIADRAGVAPADLVAALSRSSAASGMLELFRQARIDHDVPFTPGSVALIRKDMALVAECVRSMGITEPPVLTWVDDVYGRGAADAALTALPFPEIARVVAGDLDGTGR